MNINENGLKQIHAFLTANHKLEKNHFDKHMLRAWARDAEFQYAEGNGATIEISGRDSISGNPICFTVADSGIDDAPQ